MNSTCTVVCILIAGEYSQHFAMLPLVFLEMMSEEGVACRAGVFFYQKLRCILIAAAILTRPLPWNHFLACPNYL